MVRKGPDVTIVYCKQYYCMLWADLKYFREEYNCVKMSLMIALSEHRDIHCSAVKCFNQTMCAFFPFHG